ncbi:MAG: MFS transporter [Dehalococcoidia bacterium]|nr:MFS transporter [Dehalococcoidia bacterium]
MTNTPEKPGIYYGYIIIAAGFWIWLIGYGTTATFSVFLKPMLAEFGWSRGETALALSMAVIVQAFLAIAMGWLTDKLGPRLVLMTFGSLLGIGYLLISVVQALWQFQLDFAILIAIGLSTLSVPGMATISRWFTRRRALMIGIVQAGGGIGGLIYAPFVGWLISVNGWRFGYLVMGAITLVGILVAGSFLRRDPAYGQKVPYVATDVIPYEIKTQEPDAQTRGLSLKQAIRTSQFWMLAAMNLTLGFCRTTFLAHTAAYVQDLGFSLASGANVVAVIMASTVIGRVGMGRVGDRIGNKRAYIIGFVATLVSLIWLMIARDLWGLYLFALAFGFGWGAQSVLRFALASEAFGLASVGLVFGSLTFAEAIAGSLGSYFAGYIYDSVGSYEPVFGIGIALSIMGIILAWRLKPIKKL